MPLKEYHKEPGLSIYLWHLTETVEELQVLLNQAGRADLIPDPPFHAPVRNLEWMAARLLVINVAGNDEDIIYDASGRPHLRSGKGHISITHTATYVGLIYADKPVGIDIEEVGQKAVRIRSKFVNEREDAWIADKDAANALHLIWAAKESVFKLIGGGGILFKEHLEVLTVSLQDKGQAEVIYSKHQDQRIPVNYEFFDGMILVYTTIAR